ncbi:phosphoglycerate dehydrogenase [Lachnospiraceae bacterium ZAX-1]
MYQYHCLNPIADVGLDLFAEGYENVTDLQDAQVALVRSASLHEMEFSENLEVIARAGAGVNNIPLEECAQAGIVVLNTPGANANGVKELVFAGMLLASRDIIGGIEWIHGVEEKADIAQLAEKQKKDFAGSEIAGKKLGIIGLGAIGVRVANAATHLGMEVYGYDPYISVNAAWELSRTIKRIKSAEEIYSECDYITIHVPLMDETRKMINKEVIGKMKTGVVILNFARDLLVDEDDMVEALNSGKVKKYVTDFPNPTVVGVKGIIVTPHLGASTQESEDNCAIMAVNQVMEYMENGNIINSVNYPNCDLGSCTQAGRIAILHKNIKGMIGKYAVVLGDADINISNMANKSRGDYAYALLDLDAPITKEVVEKLKATEGVLKVRVVKW